jgi:hypothetical protein
MMIVVRYPFSAFAPKKLANVTRIKYNFMSLDSFFL